MYRNKLADRARLKDIVSLSETLPTPHIIIDLEMIRANFRRMRSLCSYADIYYAVKACPLDKIVSMLYEEGSNFDIASRYELDRALALGVEPERLLYGNTIKKAEDIAYFHEKGVRFFATDCENDVRKIAQNAPGSNVYFRVLLPHSDSADWPLSRKFGCSAGMVLDLISLAKELKLNPIGVSFHVGSQQRNLEIWDQALKATREIFDKSPVKLGFVDMGGGLPAQYNYPVEDLETYAVTIKSYIDNYFKGQDIRFIMEPGRSLVGDSGVLAATVVETSKKDNADNVRWVYIDAGKFNGMVETIDESIKYSAYFPSRDENAPSGPVILAGPTCDSMDIMYENYKMQMPLDLKAGERVYFLAAGAYTASYASVCFNGFPPIRTYIYR